MTLSSSNKTQYFPLQQSEEFNIITDGQTDTHTVWLPGLPVEAKNANSYSLWSDIKLLIPFTQNYININYLFLEVSGISTVFKWLDKVFSYLKQMLKTVNAKP